MSLHDDSKWPSVDWSKLRNYESDSKLGFSQVTAVVECNKSTASDDDHYDVLFGAELVNPYYVTLVDPVELSKNDLANINILWTANRYNVSGKKECLHTTMAGNYS